MADETPSSKSGTKTIGAIIAGIIYAIILIFGVIINMKTKNDYAVDASFTLFWISWIPFIVLILCAFDNLKVFEQQKSAFGFVAYHVAVWLILILLPFGQYPKLSSLLFMGAILSMAALKATFKNKDESDKNDAESLKGMSKLGKNIATLMVIAIIFLALFTKTSLGDKAKEYYHKTASYIGMIGVVSPSNESSNIFGGSNSDLSNDDTYYPEDEKPNQMTATVNSYSYPLDFGAECPIMTNANVTVNFGDNIVKAKINFKRGSIVIDNGTVDSINEDGYGSVSGSWRQSKTGLSGSYKLSITGKQTGVLILYSGDTRIALIDLYSSADI